MSVESVLQRVAALEQALSNPAALLAVARTGGTAAPSGLSETAPEPSDVPGSPSFADALQSANAAYAAPVSASAPPTTGVATSPYGSATDLPGATTGTLG